MPHVTSCFKFVCRALAGLVLVMVGARGASAGPTFVYALDQVSGGSNLIYGFRLDATSGTLTPLGGFPVSSGGVGGAGSLSEHVVYSNGRLFVVNEGQGTPANPGTLSVLTVNPITGGLSPLPFSPIALGAVADPACVVVHPTGSPVVVAGSGKVTSFVVTASTATPGPSGPVTTGSSPFSCAFSQDGQYVYTGGNSGPTVGGFAVALDGSLAALAGSPFDSSAGNPVGYATDSTGRLFVSNYATGVRVFTTISGVPTGVIGNPFTSGLSGGVRGLLHPSGFYMVADRGANRVGVFQISGSGAATTLSAVGGSPFTTGGTFTDTIALSPDGSILLAANGISRNLTIFRVDSGTGSLASLSTQPANTLGAAGIITGLAVASSPIHAPGDFDGDGKSDITQYVLAAPSSPVGAWYTWSSVIGTGLPGFVWGNGTDKPLAADFDGDGKSDIAVYRPSTGAWYIVPSSPTAVPYGLLWGNSADRPVPADYDGDGRADVAIFRPSNGTWYVVPSSTGVPYGFAWGNGADIPTPGDYDGDGKADIAVFRPSNGTWYVVPSSTGVPFSFAWGNSADRPVAADYDGDRKTDIAVFRPSNGTWYVVPSTTGVPYGYAWGNSADTLVPGDFDGDGKTDVAVYRPSDFYWYVVPSSTGVPYSISFGGPGVIPILKRP